LLGPVFIISEFAAGVLLSLALGAFVLLRAGSEWQIALGLYFLSLGLNYVPMLVYAIEIARRGSALAEIGSELSNKREAMAKYRRQSLFLLVPLVVPAVALRRAFLRTG
jgi:hypothetical protein